MSDIEPTMSPTQREAERIMTICNACRYCEGLCAVFPAMELRNTFSSGDLNYLANLCHSCGACYFDCQYAPPHEFKVNVPQTLHTLRADSYAQYAWPRACAGLFERNGLVISVCAALSVAVFVIALVWTNAPAVFFSAHSGAGAFYAVMPHGWMVWIFGSAFVYAMVALAMGVRSFWRAAGDYTAAPSVTALWRAMRDAAVLRNLEGGGGGCMDADERPDARRRVYHHFTFYGFLLCFASTSVATLYHYCFAWQAPYGLLSVPVVLGTLGGIGLLVGPAGLLKANWRRAPETKDDMRSGMDIAFIAMLFLVSFTGMALLILRETAAMGIVLAVHLGFVFGFFITMPYGKFVHGIYRFAALTRHAMEQRR